MLRDGGGNLMARPWHLLQPGDVLWVRPKRHSGEPRKATIARLLDRDLMAGGLGFVDATGETFRQWFYDVEIFTDQSPATRRMGAASPVAEPRLWRGRSGETGWRSWKSVQAGDTVTLRSKRAPRPPVTLVVVDVLGRDHADGRGLIDDTGTVFRQFYYDIVIHRSPEL